jgi:hypothetical protein
MDYWIAGLIRLGELLKIKEICKTNHIREIQNAYSEIFLNPSIAPL